MYLTYEDYLNMGGTLDEVSFGDYEFEAETIVNWYTFDRLKNETEPPVELKRCMNVLIKLAKLKADALALGSQTVQTTDADGNTTTVTTTSAIASQSNDGVSISYNVVSATEAYRALSMKDAGNILEETVKRYLQGVKNSLGQKVLYRGVYPNE